MDKQAHYTHLVERANRKFRVTNILHQHTNEIAYDVIVIGAGINGAGIARDAAMRGLKVLLLDKGDIGGGTSSWSTRLIHGGLRYLEHGEFGLVRESLRERATLMRIAPHLVRPLPIFIPIYENARRGLWTTRAGLVAYDLLAFDEQLPRHRMLSRAEALQQVPALDPTGLLGGAFYYDAQVEFAERLVVDNVLSAKEYGATVKTYAKVQKLIIEDGAVRGVEGLDVLAGETFAASGRMVVNASGPWVDQVLNEGTHTRRLIGGTKGSHLIVAPFTGAPTTALYVEAETDSRPFFIIPWNGKYLIGTTDMPFAGDLDELEIEVEEIDYLLRETNRVIPVASLTRDSILYTYSGVRPLPYTKGKKEEAITRKHFIWESEEVQGLFSIVGGKLTTYRKLSEQTVDLIFKKFGKDAPNCMTASAALPGASSQSPDVLGDRLKRAYRLSSRTSERLPRVYGTRASEILQLASEGTALLEVFDEETGAIAAEVVFAFKHDLAQTLSDCLLRRTMVGLNSRCGLDAVEAAASIAQKHLGWSESRAHQETDAYRKEISRRFPRTARI
jgi:glycerol-3-phosphate dehydrogenase